MEIGVQVWVRDTKGTLSWSPAIVHSKIVKQTADGRYEQEIIAREEGSGVEYSFRLNEGNQEDDNLKLRNDSNESVFDNLINLPYLHEPAILYCLQLRYYDSDIYTYTGPILIAMNPFKKVPLYTTQILEVYYNMGLLKSQGIEGGQQLPPHVYAIADAAYRKMMQVMLSSHTHGMSMSTMSLASASAPGSSTAQVDVSVNHSILISGESGAGKTESTKIVLRYLTTVGNSSGGLELVNGSVMDKVLQSNPILEAFGNARTLRNDNSSRFGKFIELHFNRRGHLVGGTIKTYLLEKVRLPSQQAGERNFHIFYQITSEAANESTIDEEAVEARKRWRLTSAEDYQYSSQGGIFKLDGVDDKKEYKELRKAFDTLNFDKDHQHTVFDIIAALLHIGQVSFTSIFDGEGEGSAVEGYTAETAHNSPLSIAASLLGLSVEDLIRTLTVRTIVARDESYEKKLTAKQASDAKDALAKAIYGKMFDWIVSTINISIKVDAKQIRATIGVLDIFGFECFDNNSFEQLCINYTNETLQQQFNQYIFKMEQIEYSNEKISWSFVEFPDNQDCLDLIEGKPNGILAMVDDECRLPNSSDEKLASRMYKALEAHSRFSASAPQRRDYKFCIKHYAGPVTYCSLTFVEKNKDELPKEAFHLLEASSRPLLAMLFGPPPSAVDPAKPAGAPSGKKTSFPDSVGSQFKGQLQGLMDKIYTTTPHYIRCLKPNDQNAPDSFHRLRITEQLRYGGVLEAVRVARSGFPVRLGHFDFYARYRALGSSQLELPLFMNQYGSKEDQTNIKGYCDKLRENLLRAGTEEDRRSAAVVTATGTSSVITTNDVVQVISQESIQLGLSKVFLRKSAHDILESRRSRKLISAAQKIQATFRCCRIRIWYVNTLYATKYVQRIIRGMLGRKVANAIRRKRASTHMQAYFRRYRCEKRFLRFKWSVAVLQSLYRGKKVYKATQLLRANRNAIKLQCIVLGLLVRRKVARFYRALIVLQNKQRKARAKTTLKNLRAHAKDIGKLKQSNDALKAEIEALRAKAEEDRANMKIEAERQMQEKASLAQVEEMGIMKYELDNNAKLLEIERQLRKKAEEKLTVAENKVIQYEALYAETEKKRAQAEKDLKVLKAHVVKTTESEKHGNRQSIQSFDHMSSTTSSSASLASPGPPDIDSRNWRVVTTPSTSSSSMHHANSSPATPASSSSSSSSSSSNGSADGSPVSSFSAKVIAVDVHQRVVDALEKERKQRKQLDEEMKRLRVISMEYKAQIETIRRSSGLASPVPLDKSPAPADTITTTAAATTAPSTAPSAASPSSSSPIGVSAASLVFSAADASPSPAVSPGGEKAASVSRPAAANQAIISSVRRRTANSSITASSTDTVTAAPSPAEGLPLSPIGRASLRTEPVPATRPRVPSVSAPAPAPASVAPTASATPSINASNAARRPSLSSSQRAPEASSKLVSVLGAFEKNLEAVRHKLKQGFKGVYWEGTTYSNVEIHLKLDQSNRLITFETSQIRRGFSLFQYRIDITPVRLSDIVECLPGAEIKTEASEQSLLLTVVTKDENGESRILALKFMSRDQRNNVLTGLRTLIADLHINTPSARMLKDMEPIAGKVSGGGVGSQKNVNPMIRKSINEGGGMNARRPSRGEAGGYQTVSAKSEDNTPTGTGLLSNAPPLPYAGAEADTSRDDNTEELNRQLKAERTAYERMMIQMLVLANDLNDREELIAVLKKKEQNYEQTILDRDSMFKQDAMVRMQLGKRLEQVLMDKEEALDQLEFMKDQVEALKGNFAAATGMKL